MKTKAILFFAIIGLLSAGLSSAAVGETKSKRKSAAKNAAAKSAAKAAAVQGNPKVDPKASPDGYSEVSSTRIDFSDTAVDGQMKSPEGFMLQGNQRSSLSDMVKLRSNFRNELNNSKSATKAIVK